MKTRSLKTIKTSQDNVITLSWRKRKFFETDVGEEFVNKTSKEHNGTKNNWKLELLSIETGGKFLPSFFEELLEVFFWNPCFEEGWANWINEINAATKKHLKTKLSSTTLLPIRASPIKNEDLDNNILSDKNKKIKPEMKIGDFVWTADKRMFFFLKMTIQLGVMGCIQALKFSMIHY